MADFYQNGTITTLHNLGERSTSDLEQDLLHFSARRPLGLILPALYSEIETPALPAIIRELKSVPYLSQIVIGLDRATQDEYQHALHFFSDLPQYHRVLWNDGPRLKAIDARLQEAGLAPQEFGKGRNVWYCMGYALATGRAEAIALHDCDILTYDRSLLARLIYPVAHSLFGYEFCKGYYPRVSENKINGRVCRLLVTPMIRALKRIVGESPYLNYLDSYRYILAGEFAFRKRLLGDLRIPTDWGLEIGVVSEVYRSNSNKQICQVDIADNYDHKHQDLSFDDQSAGLSRMSLDIARSLYRKLAIQGTVFSPETFRTLKATYYRMALDLIETYRNDAIMNGLSFDIHKEEEAIELFAENILIAGTQFLERSTDAPFIPTWNRVFSAMPGIFDALVEAVEADHADFFVSHDGPEVAQG
ncbi:MAG: glycosyl transferase [Halieaceae bacterium]|nr:glycosyl transferase [Halieaceae bacterium]